MSDETDHSAPATSPRKDTWDKIDIIGKGIVLPLMVAGLTVGVNVTLSNYQGTLTSAQQDITILTAFREIYYKPESKRLGVVFTSRLSDHQIRRQLLQFMVWDILEKQMSQHGGDQVLIFDSEEPDWHMLGDIVHQKLTESDMSPEKDEFIQWWTWSVKSTASQRWVNHAEVLSQAFQWVEKNYVQSEVGPDFLLKLKLPEDTL